MKRLLLAGLSFFSVQAKDHTVQDLITGIRVNKNHLEVTIDKGFKTKFLKNKDFYATYDDDLDLSTLDESLLVLPFVSNVISIIWISGRTYSIDALDADFYESLKTIKKVFRRMYPETNWDGELIPRKLVHNKYKRTFVPQEKERTALMFSGGLDSVSSSLNHRDKKQLLITVNGHWDLPLSDKKLLKKRRKQLSAWGAQNGHENSFIDSNYYDFLDRWLLDHWSHEITSWRIFTVEGIGWAGLAAPIMALKGYDVLLHASTITWEFNFPACANPFIDDNIRFGGMRLKHDMFDINRLGKCDFIAHLCKIEGIERPFIRVCEGKTPTNCEQCQKCIRTMIELHVAGENPADYGFPPTLEKVLSKSEKFLKEHGTGATTVWHFMHIQKRLRNEHAQGKCIHKGLRWLLDYNLKKKLTSEIKNQRRLDWRDFIDLLPDVKVPDSIELGF